MLGLPTTPRRFGTPITNGISNGMPIESPHSAAKKAATLSKTPASKQKRAKTPASAKPIATRPEAQEARIFGRFGVLQVERGPTPPEATAFGLTGLLERERGPTPAEVEAFGVAGVLQRERGPVPKATTRANLEAEEVKVFCETHEDATMLPGRVRCETTRHEMPVELDVIVSHWGGRRYQKAAKKMASNAASTAATAASKAKAGLMKRKKLASPSRELPLLDGEDVGVPVVLIDDGEAAGAEETFEEAAKRSTSCGIKAVSGGVGAVVMPPLKRRSKKSRVRAALAASGTSGTQIDAAEWSERWTVVKSRAERQAEKQAQAAKEKAERKAEREHRRRKREWTTHVQEFLSRQRQRELDLQRERLAEKEAAAIRAEAEAEEAEAAVAAAEKAEAEARAASEAAQAASAAMEAAKVEAERADAALAAALAAKAAAEEAAASIAELPPTRSLLDTPVTRLDTPEPARHRSFSARGGRPSGRGAEDRENRSPVEAPRSRGTPAAPASSGTPAAKGATPAPRGLRSQQQRGGAGRPRTTAVSFAPSPPSYTPAPIRAATLGLRKATPKAAPPQAVTAETAAEAADATLSPAAPSPPMARPSPSYADVARSAASSPTTPLSRGGPPVADGRRCAQPATNQQWGPPLPLLPPHKCLLRRAPSVQFVRNGSQLPFGLPTVDATDAVPLAAPPATAAAMSMDDLFEAVNAMKVAELKRALAAVGQHAPSAGRKAELSAKLKEAITPAKARPPPTSAPTPAPTPALPSTRSSRRATNPAPVTLEAVAATDDEHKESSEEATLEANEAPPPMTPAALALMAHLSSTTKAAPIAPTPAAPTPAAPTTGVAAPEKEEAAASEKAAAGEEAEKGEAAPEQAAPPTRQSARQSVRSRRAAFEAEASMPPPPSHGAPVLSCTSRSVGIATPNVAARRVLRSTKL